MVLPGDIEADRVRAALRDPAALVGDEPAALATFVLRSQGLQQLADALCRCPAPVLLVKGAALALTLYPQPWQRGMCDVDLLVGASDREHVVAALEQAGCRRCRTPQDRPWSGAMLGEVPLAWQVGSLRWLIEVHHTLDKVVSRPVAYADIFARAQPAPGLSRFGIPCPEDHALLIALHLAASEVRHPVGLVDLELLLRAGLDIEAVVLRARQWRLCTSLFLALSVLRGLDAPSVTEELVERFRPRRLRRAALEGFYDLRRYPPARRPKRLGWPWILAQTPLRDDSSRWGWGVTRYAFVRAAERGLGWLGSGAEAS